MLVVAFIGLVGLVKAKGYGCQLPDAKQQSICRSVNITVPVLSPLTKAGQSYGHVALKNATRNKSIPTLGDEHPIT